MRIRNPNVIAPRLQELAHSLVCLRHPNKKLKVLCSITSEIPPLQINYDLSRIDFVGTVPNNRMLQHYNKAHVKVLHSIKEGPLMAIGEALALCCPLVASENTGGHDFFIGGTEGFIVMPRDVDTLVQRLEALMQEKLPRQRMYETVPEYVTKIGSCNTYGERWTARLSNEMR